MRYIIIEDEPLAAAKVRDFADRLPYLQHAASFENAVPAIAHLNNNTVDLIFLDINIGELSGIQLLEIARPNCAIIILTAYQEYALKGFEMNVTDYLLKPFTFERFCQAVEKAHNFKSKLPEKQFIFIKTQHRLEKVILNELLYIEGARDYRRIHAINQTLLTLQTFGQLEKELPANKFLRVHRSYLVALDKVTSVERDMIHIGDALIPLSETYKKVFFARING